MPRIVEEVSSVGNTFRSLIQNHTQVTCSREVFCLEHFVILHPSDAVVTPYFVATARIGAQVFRGLTPCEGVPPKICVDQVL